MRLFIAADLEDATKEAAARLSADLERALVAAHAARAGDAKWVQPGSMHLTLRFLGDVDASTTPPLIAALAPASSTRAFSLALGDVGFFPERGRPHVVWLSVVDGASSLAALHAEVDLRLATLGIVPDDRPYVPHLTLARFKRAPGARAREAIAGAPRAAIPPSSITRLTLFESRLGSAGATHVPIGQMPLG